MTIPDRDLRQRSIVPPERLAACDATIVGVGSIGRQVAIQLAALGVPRLQLIDFDQVEPVNLAVQAYFTEDLDRAKVHATAEVCHRLNPQAQLTVHESRFRRHMAVGDLLFCCVDSIETRALIWESVRDRVRFFADGRMAAEIIRVLTACDEPSRRHYPTTLFDAESAHRGACTTQSTIFTANIAAGLMIEQFTRFLRGLAVDDDVQFNLLAMELTVGDT